MRAPAGSFALRFHVPRGEERGRDGHIRSLKEIEISAYCMLVACTLISDVDIA